MESNQVGNSQVEEMEEVKYFGISKIEFKVLLMLYSNAKNEMPLMKIMRKINKKNEEKDYALYQNLLRMQFKGLVDILKGSKNGFYLSITQYGKSIVENELQKYREAVDGYLNDKTFNGKYLDGE